MTDQCRPLGYQEIAALLEVKDTTVRMWKWSGKLPPPDYPLVHGFPTWEQDTIVRWAGETRRARSTKVRRLYRQLVGEAPPEARSGGRPTSSPPEDNGKAPEPKKAAKR